MTLRAVFLEDHVEELMVHNLQNLIVVRWVSLSLIKAIASFSGLGLEQLSFVISFRSIMMRTERCLWRT